MKLEPRRRVPFTGRAPFAALAALALALVLAAVIRLLTGAASPPPTAEARAHSIGERLACPICQGLSVADSPSALAGQMRAVIVEQIAEGRSDAQIEQYYVVRYGQAILLTPPKRGFTLLVWWVPVLVIVASAIGLAIAAYRWSRRTVVDELLPDLTADEERRYADRLTQELAEAGNTGEPGEPTATARSDNRVADAGAGTEARAW